MIFVKLEETTTGMNKFSIPLKLTYVASLYRKGNLLGQPVYPFYQTSVHLISYNKKIRLMDTMQTRKPREPTVSKLWTSLVEIQLINPAIAFPDLNNTPGYKEIIPYH